MIRDRFFKFVFIAAIAMTIFSPLIMAYFVLPMYTHVLTKNTEDEAERVASHLATMFTEDNLQINRTLSSSRFAGDISALQRDFLFMKLMVLSTSGEVVYSTDASELGEIRQNEPFANVIRERTVFSKFLRSGEESIEGRQYRADVVETYVPIIIRDELKGVFEFYYDVTEKKKRLDNALMYALAVFLGSMAGFIAIITIIFIRLDSAVKKEYQEVLLGNYRTPVLPFIIILITVFLLELVIMTVVDQQKLGSFPSALIDSVLLLVLATPVLYFFLVRPLMLHLYERRNVEEALRSSHDLNSAVIDNMHEAIGVISTDEFRIIRANRSFTDFYGLSEEDLPNKPCFDMIRECLRYDSDNLCPMQETLITGKSASAEVEYTDESGEKRHYRITSIPLTGAEGDVEKIVHITSDITERAEYEETLLRAKKLAEEASEAKGRFLANMSHEIRTPMNGVLGMIDLALDTRLTDEQREYLLLANRSANFLLALLNNALDVSRIEAGQVRIQEGKFDLHRILSDLKDIMAPEAEEKGVSLVLNIRPDIPVYVIGDEGKLKQVLFNLIGNAVKFTREGRISISVERMDVLDESEDTAKLCFSVADTGIGIPREKVERIFESFYQVDSTLTKKFGGTGLGLVISRELVRLMGGKIEVDSEEGVGSTFRFTLSLAIGIEEEDREPDYVLKGRGKVKGANNGNGGQPADAPLRVLVTEDDLLCQHLVEKILTKRGMNVVKASTGREAVDILSRESFDLVVMDVRMPDMDGLEATRIIRDRSSGVLDHEVPIIALTAHALTGYRERCLEVGMDHYITKPLRSEELLNAVDLIISRKNEQ